MLRKLHVFSRLIAVALFFSPTLGQAQVEQDSGVVFFSVPDGSAAPNEFGWQLPPDDSGRWEAAPEGANPDFLLSNFFASGIALGKTATGWGYPIADGGEGPAFVVYQSGFVTILDAKDGEPFSGVHGDAPLGASPDNLAGVSLFKSRTFDGMNNDVPEVLAPRWAEIADTAELAALPNFEDCADKQKVYFWASSLDPSWQAAGDETGKLVVTWKNMVPRGSDCADPSDVISFQLVLTARAALANNRKDRARVEYRFGNCGWTVPMVANPAEASGPRTGLILDGAGGEDRVALELLGEHDAVAVVQEGIGLAADDPRVAVPGVSGDPLRGSEYCRSTNLEWELAEGENGEPGRRVASEPGRYVIDLGENGLPSHDADGDGVTDAIDNCDAEYNPLQANFDGDVLGDVCDDNVDQDEYLNAADKCILLAVQDNGDLDLDGLGDACDRDEDGDGWFFPTPGLPHLEDNCPRARNPRQWDFNEGRDGDEGGDACDWEGSFFKFLSEVNFDFALKRIAVDGFTDAETDEMMGMMAKASSLDLDELYWMLIEAFSAWGKTKATFSEFVNWQLEQLMLSDEKSK